MKSSKKAARRERRTFCAEFKAEAVRLMRERAGARLVVLAAVLAAGCRIQKPTPGSSSPVRVLLDTVSVAGAASSVVFRTTLVNVSGAPLELMLISERRPEGYHYNVEVFDRRDSLVWQRKQVPRELPGVTNVVVAEGMRLSLGPHGQVSWLTSWNGRSADGRPLPAGHYTAIATIPVDTGETEIRSPPLPIELRP